MHRKPCRVINTRTAARVIIYAPAMIPERTEETPRGEILEPKPRKKVIPGTQLLKKMMRDREKQKEKQRVKKEDAAIGKRGLAPEDIEVALAGIIADLEK